MPHSVPAFAPEMTNREENEDADPGKDQSFSLPEADVPERLPKSAAASPGISMSTGMRMEGLSEDLQSLMVQQHHEVMLQLSTQNRLLQDLLAKGRIPLPVNLVPPAAPIVPSGRRPSVHSQASASSSGVAETPDSSSKQRRASAEQPGQKGRRRFLKSFSAVDRALRRVAAEAHKQRLDLLPSGESELGPQKPCAVRIVEHPLFEVFFTLVIVANAAFVGFETQYSIDHPFKARWDFFYVSAVFTALFIIELLFRISAFGRAVFCSHDWIWGWLDLVICVTSILQLVDDLTILSLHDDPNSDSIPSSSSRALRIIRIARILRAVRVVRVLRFVAALRTLLMSIFHTLKSLFWALLLLVLIVYVFATLFAFAVSEHVNDSSMPPLPRREQEAADMYFTSVARTMLSLFMSISGGLNWVELIFVLEEISIVWEFCFFFYVSFTYFAVLNVVTAVFCQVAIDSAQQDQASVIQAILQNKELHLEKIRHLFSQFGGEGCDTITFAMFEQTIKEPKVREYFESLGLDIWDAWSFFKLLDLDSGGEVEIDEFLMGCLRLRGNARAVDVGKLIHDQSWLIKNFGRFQGHVEAQLSHLTGLLAPVAGADQVVESLGPLMNSRGMSPPDTFENPAQKRSKEPPR